MKKRLLYPDIMRTAALLLVFVYHFYAEFSKRIPGIGIPKVFTDKSGLASHPVAAAVSLFFMISGASLMLSSRNESAWTFYKRRFRALMIPFYVIFALGFIATLLFFGERYAGIPIWTILLSVIGMDGYLYEVIPNFYVTGEWFLGCLLLLYLCFPFLKKAVEKQPVLTALLTVILFVLLLAFFDVPLFSSRDRWFFLRIPEFVLGMFFARYLDSGKKWGYGICGLVLMSLLFITVLPERFELLQRLFITSGIYLFFRFLGELLEGKAPVLESSVHFFSSISYEFFLIHHLAILVAASLLSGRGLGTGVMVLLFLGLLIGCIFAAWILKKGIAALSGKMGVL